MSTPRIESKSCFEDRHTEQQTDQDQDSRVHSDLVVVKFIMWFEIGIKGKSIMDQEEEE